jgi:hypothetical protein
MTTILTPKSEMSTDELRDWALQWHENKLKEKNNKRKLYCRMQISETIAEMIKRGLDIKSVFINSDILSSFDN